MTLPGPASLKDGSHIDFEVTGFMVAPLPLESHATKPHENSSYSV